MTVIFDSWAPLITIFAAAVAPTLAAIYSGRQARIAAANASSMAIGVANSMANTQGAVINKLDEVHALVNSQLTDAITRLNTAMDEISSLRLIIKNMKASPKPSPTTSMKGPRK